MNNIKLSIITITYNNPDLKRTLDSVLAQRDVDRQIEHIIVDNLSNDDTEQIVNLYKKKALYEIKYIREKDNGRYDAMNKGVLVARGEYLSFMNAGDHFFDKKSIKEIIGNASGKDIIYGNLEVVIGEKKSIYHPPDFVDFKYFLSSALPHQASIIKKSLFEKIGNYDNTLIIAADQKFYLLAICKFNCSYFHLKKTIATYYFNGISSDPKSAKLNRDEKNRILNEEFSQQETEKKIVELNDDGFETPILFLIFNRPEQTQRVFDAIRKIKPKRLFVAADGGRENKEGEFEKCEKTREIIKKIDWNCEVKTLYRKVNFGCGNAISRAITWFFENVEEGIILEDDCVPDRTFFKYCEELLEKYRLDSRIMHINGTSLVLRDAEESYYFSKYYHVWGWATWRRAWSLYDFSIENFPIFRDSKQIENVFFENKIQEFWNNCFSKVYEGKIDTWDYQWVYTNLINNGISIMPFTNLVSNVGFGGDATHTVDEKDINANRKTGNIREITHPLIVIPNLHFDKIIYESMGISFGQSSELANSNEKKENMFQNIVQNRLIKKYFLKLRFVILSPNIFLKKYWYKVLNSPLRKPTRKIWYWLRGKDIN